MLSLGDSPYGNLDNIEVLEMLERGERLGCPEMASEELYKIMLSCWEGEAKERPSFEEISKSLGRILDVTRRDYGYVL